MSDWANIPGLGVPTGWQCPVCGSVYAPGIPKCTHCEARKLLSAKKTKISPIPFSDKIILSADFEQWTDGKNVAKDCVGFLSFLEVFGMLDRKAVKSYLSGRRIE